MYAKGGWREQSRAAEYIYIYIYYFLFILCLLMFYVYYGLSRDYIC